MPAGDVQNRVLFDISKGTLFYLMARRLCQLGFGNY